MCISSLQSWFDFSQHTNSTAELLGSSLLVNSQRSSRIVVHAPVSRHMEIIRLLKRPDRVPGVWPHHTQVSQTLKEGEQAAYQTRSMAENHRKWRNYESF